MKKYKSLKEICSMAIPFDSHTIKYFIHYQKRKIKEFIVYKVLRKRQIDMFMSRFMTEEARNEIILKYHYKDYEKNWKEVGKLHHDCFHDEPSKLKDWYQ